VTCPSSPRDLFCSVAPSQMDQLYRRFPQVYNLDDEDEKKMCMDDLQL
jgi:hypothetical protein